MPVLGVTGGIATGKTTFTSWIARELEAEVFNADDAVRSLFQTSDKVRETLREQFGSEVLTADGVVNRPKLREIVFQNEAKRLQLEAILHPAVRSLWTARVAEHRRTGERGWIVLDIPLLFETNTQRYADAVAVVGCSPETQLLRLMENRSLAEPIASRMMAAQLDLTMKIREADHLVWNDGEPSHLTAQAALLAAVLRTRHE